MNESQDPTRTSPQTSPPPVENLSVPPAGTADLPAFIDRYRVIRILGEGGFGRVYLAHDAQLDRQIAIKVPHRHLITKLEDTIKYLTEARHLATLDHPNIVPVHDVGDTEDGLCFVVSKFIEGTDLAKKIKEGAIPYSQTADLVAKAAEALHYAHQKGLVHRDVKPANILIDLTGKPYIADFGLALNVDDSGNDPRFAGTPAYMSPEQARGEVYRVDGRSDIFSLGVVLYELLTGRRPFRAETPEKLLERIITVEPRPPRQICDAIPKELERICLKALSKRSSERYTTAMDLADELRQVLAEAQLLTTGRRDSDELPSLTNNRASPQKGLLLKAGRESTGCTVSITFLILFIVVLPTITLGVWSSIRSGSTGNIGALDGNALRPPPDLSMITAKLNSPKSNPVSITSFVGHMSSTSTSGSFQTAVLVASKIFNSTDERSSAPTTHQE